MLTLPRLRASLSQVVLAWTAWSVVTAQMPPCEDSAVPPIAGYVSQNNLVLDEGCRYKLYETEDATRCLQGNWIVIAGSSNTLLEFNNLIHFLVPEEFDINRTGELIGISAMIDVIVENGKVTHWEQMPNTEPACRQVNASDVEELRPQCKEKMAALLSKVPKRASHAIRVTFVTAFFWYRSDLAMEVVDENPNWKDGKLGFVTQIGAWYFYCCKLKFSYCPRKELMELDMYGKGMDAFKEEMAVSLKKMQDWCKIGGRVQLGCYLQTISWSDGVGEREIYADMNVFVHEAMKDLATMNFKLIDFYRMGGNMPEEVLGGHGSILLNIWMWTVMFNSICPAHMAAKKSSAAFDGVMCSATQARWSNCPKYHDFCTHGGPLCEKWECMNSVRCTLRASDASKTGDLEGFCDAAIDISAFAEDKSKTCHRLWCHEDVQWLLPAAVSLLALLLKLFLVLRDKESLKDMQILQVDGLSPMSPWRGSTSPSRTRSKVDLEKSENQERSEVHDPESSLVAGSRAPLLDDGGDKRELGKAERGEREEKNRFGMENEENEEKEQKDINLPRAGHKYPLGLARFIASSHVVTGHLFARGVVDPIYFFGWGFTWVPWFFMLSGFVLFSAYLNKPKREDSMFGYVLRRSGTIYPLYAVALVLAFVLGKVQGNILTEWPTLLSQCFLMQAWVPYFTENSLQMHCWFLSCMVVYWFFFPPVSRVLKDISLPQTWSLMMFFFFLPWLLVLIPIFTHEEVDWYKNHDFYQTDSYLDIGVVMLKYHPICYFHVFILGMLLAKLRQLLDVHAKSLEYGCFSWRNPYNVLLQVIAPLGYLGVLFIFSDQNLNAKAWGYKLSARVSVLLPFQAMILFGLAGLPSLPFPFFSYLFSMMDFLENYSYTVYVFQFLLYDLWPQSGDVNLPLFLIFVYASAYVIGNCIQQPISAWWTSHPKGQLAVPFLLAFFFMAGCFCPELKLGSTDTLAAVIRIDNETVDMNLGLLDDVGRREGAFIINPSLLWMDDEVIVVARRHRLETRQTTGWYQPLHGEKVKAVIMEQIWHSKILMGSQPFASKQLVDQMLDHWPRSDKSLLLNLSLKSWDGLSTSSGDAWRDLCVVERWIPSNKTLMRLVVTGPEDPKIFPNGDGSDGFYIAFDSQPPSSSDCRRNTKGMLDSVPQMYLASMSDADRWQETKAHRLSYGSMNVAEKNWIPFLYEGKTYFVYTPVPHVIVSAEEDGTSKMLYSTTYYPLHVLRQQRPQVEVRGSAQAVLITANFSNIKRPHYLALLHLFDRSTKRYAHHAYRFQHEPPFMILQVSSQLPLSEAAAMPSGVPFAFASGLTVKGSAVVVTYGAGDRESRALVTTLEKLDEFFQCG